ncbi:uncharacterized protein LOC124656393 [Lolium rigidum]|uniref:uncharacterized protein LOC124656393 n=1 Tax=Lolium rigidum TaxID=89674 RepID=UPI001F5DBB07|nr:uncharacterized protein LOC124656393 [Lolium rigidum]
MNKFKQMAKDLGKNDLVLHTKRMVDSSVEVGYQSECDYPLVLGAGILLLLLHRICPPLLAFLVSSSPLLLLTGLLLGALLSYGEPSCPSVIGEEASQTLSVKSEVSVADCSVEGDENVTVETHSEKSSAGFYISERTPTTNTHDIHWEETNVTFLAANTVLSTESAQTSVIAGREMHIEKISEKAELQEFESSNTDSGNYEAHNNYQLGESMSQCWKSADRQDPCYDSESDLTDESSSPDASITDIIPMLEELHPLIDMGTGHPALASRDNLNSSSDDDEYDLEEDDDDTSDDEDEGEEEEKDDGRNQEDVMGNSSRVDGLMELQRAKNILKFELDHRLMDLQTADATEKLKEASRFYVQVPSISTPRGKSFDPSCVSDEVIELPQIPDSAPSVLLPSQNLFDDHDSRLQETWTPRLYSPATQLKHGNLHGRHSTNPHHNGMKVEKGDISGEDALRSSSGIDAAELGKDGKLSQEARVGEEIKILSAASSGADVLKVDNERHEDNKNADFSDDVNSFSIKENGSGTSEAKDSVIAGSEESTLCCLSKANNSEQLVVQANSIDEVNSLFRCRMEEVLVQSISEPIIGQPLTVKLEDELSDPALSSDSGAIQEKTGEAFPAVGERSPELTIGDGSRELLTVENQQIADNSGLHVMEVISAQEMKTVFKQLEHVPHDSSGHTLAQEDTWGSASNMLPLETKPVEDAGSAFEELNSGHSKMETSQDGEGDLKPFELISPLQVKETQTLDQDSDCDTLNTGIKETKPEDSAEKPKSVVEGSHEEDV